MSRIFISYRRDDSAAEVGRIYDYLERTFGEDSVFKDVDDIDAGDDFRERLNEAVGQCQVLLAVIGKDWLEIADASGQRRLDNPADWVSLEIETALKRKIRVIPVLLDGVAMPRVEALPTSLESLAFRNAALVRHDPDFWKDIKYVIGVIQRHFDRMERPVSESIDTPVVKPAPKKVAEPQTQQPQEKPMLNFEVVRVNAKGNVTHREKRSAEYYREDLGGGVTLDLMRIPAGDFVMGSPGGEGPDREKPQHQVSVPEFWMGRYPVTQRQWRAVAVLPKVENSLNPEPSKFKGDERPVENVNWYEATEFCQRLAKRTGVAYRLPSEAEWEYACRAGTTTPFYFGETLSSEVVNYDASSTYGFGRKGKYRRETTTVGVLPANTFGLFDMHGNVWEWCHDYSHKNYVDAPVDGRAWLGNKDVESRVLRGGSWFSLPRDCRSATRYYNSPDDRNYIIGFRVSCRAPRTL